MKFFFLTTIVSFLSIQCLGKNPNKDIIILYTNDVHCAIDNNIGYAGLSYYKKQMQEFTPYVTLVDAGDHVQGELFGSLSFGNNIIEVMNALNYDVVIPGNHEFDYGMDQFIKFTENLKCGYISCNFRKIDNNELVLKPYKIIEYDDVKVAYVGISTPESIASSTPAYFMDKSGNFIYDFDGDMTGDKLIASIQKAVDDAKKEGADYVIVLGHNGEHTGIKRWSAPFLVEHTNGIDAFIDGHSHETTPSLMQKNKDGKEIPITQSGAKLINIGKVTIGMDGSIKTELIGKDMIKSKDDEITKLIETIKENSNFNEKLGEIIGHSEFDLITIENGIYVGRNKETNIGDLITDAFLEEAKAYGGADIAIINSGGIRSDIINDDITYGDAVNTLPFQNLCCIAEVPGQSIIDALEMSSRDAPTANGGFLQTSGLTYAIDTSIPSSVVVDERKIFVKVAGKRRVHSIYVNGEPIDPERIYRVSSIDYILINNGDGMVFKDANVTDYAYSVPYDALIDYIKKLKEIPEKYRFPQGRIIYSTIENDEPEVEEITTSVISDDEESDDEEIIASNYFSDEEDSIVESEN
eukprot:jgi/Orpsp1_1/1179734/evm.model.c7180000070579.1